MYPELDREFQEAKKELEEGDWMPDAQSVFPRDIVIGFAKAAVERQLTQLLEDTRYLELHERTDGIPLATDRGKKATRLLEHLAQMETEIQNAISIAVLEYTLKYKQVVWDLSNATMPAYRANRKKLNVAQERFNSASRALYDYYVELCTAASVVQSRKCKIYFEQSEIPKASGLYFLIHEGAIVYVGRSENLYNRLDNHDVVRKYYLQGGFVCGIILMSAGEAKSIELDVIEIVRPRENSNGKR